MQLLEHSYIFALNQYESHSNFKVLKMKIYFNTFTIFTLLFLLSSCYNSETENHMEVNQLEKDLKLYQMVWDDFLGGDTTVINTDNFVENIVIVTDEGDLIGIEACKDYYMNYLNGFSDIEWTILDAFGQGDKLVKHWNFKGTHTGDFFGMPATGNYLDLSGTTIVTMIDGKIAKEHDFFDMKSLLDQLSVEKEGNVTIDEYRPMN